MQKFTIRKGLDLPIAGPPEQKVFGAKAVSKVALVGPDYAGLRPALAVQVGDRVKIGQVLFTDMKNPGVVFTSPAGGTVESINRGERRSFQSIVIKVDGGKEEAEALTFKKYESAKLSSIPREEVVKNLVDSGMWTAFRTRPFGKIPAVDSSPAAIFVNAMDTNPLAANPEVVISEDKPAFVNGLRVLSALQAPQLFVCRAAGANIPGEDTNLPGLIEASFKGPHPAGLVGTHIHFLCPVSSKKRVWYIGYQDVMAIGKLFSTGKIDVTRVISLAGPRVDRPRLLKTRMGACVSQLMKGELINNDNRVVSGSVLNGRTACEPVDFLGRYHTQISVLEEGNKRHLFGWVMPGFTTYSFKWVNFSSLYPWKKFKMNTGLHGGHRAIVPIGSFEEVMPLDILPTYLLRSLSYKDLEEAEALGALELEEEDLALCTFVDPGKNDFGAMLREVLTTIEKEG